MYGKMHIALSKLGPKFPPGIFGLVGQKSPCKSKVDKLLKKG